MDMDSGRIRRPRSGDDIGDLHAAFAACDADGDGRMTHDEFESLLQSVGSQLSAVQRGSEFSRIDANADGLIDLSEFRSWWQGI